MTVQRSECLLSECLDAIIQHGKDDIDVVARIIANKIPAGLQRLSPRLILRIAEDPGRDQRKADGMAVVLPCQDQGLLVRAVKQLWLMVLAVTINRADGVDDVLCRKIKSRRDRGAAGLAGADGVTRSSQLVIARLLEDCPADTAARGERGVGGVDDSVSVENGDAGFLDGYGAHVHFSMTVKSLN